jgi:D-tagatose-1,6-bisphosphate aldolase subunit GatZ/KbaZ
MLDDLLNKKAGIPSFCTSHPVVLSQILNPHSHRKVLIETTCNQVNQFGGYSGMTPRFFVDYLQNIAAQTAFPVENIILGGDHLGPNVWQNEPAESAMQKSVEMVRAYVRAGYTKIHLDCSMRLADDPAGPVDPLLIAERAADLAKAAEEVNTENKGGNLQYVIGTEVPVPGGATAHEEGVHVSLVRDVRNTIEVHRQFFHEAGLDNAWNNVIAVVVQPGVEFGDDFVLDYQPQAAQELSSFIESQGLVFEAHSTDYQSTESLHNLVQDHFCILKVGPELTFSYREAVFSLAMMENELIKSGERSNLIEVLDQVMIQKPEHWQKYYRGSLEEQAFKRKFSLSDRIRYYWAQPQVQNALNLLMKNLSATKLPLSLVSQFASREKSELLEKGLSLTPENIVASHISRVLNKYWNACERS